MIAPKVAEPAPWFEEVAAEVGVDFRHVSGHQRQHLFPEILAGGAGLCDFDGDGDLDLYAVQGGSLGSQVHPPPGNRLYRNDGQGRFGDVTERAGVGDSGYGMGCSCGDYDGDGHVDLYVTNVGPNVLYRNNGDGTFRDVSREAGVDDSFWSSSSAFFDYDRDGDLDLFVVNYIRWSPNSELRCTSLGGIPDYCKPVNYRAPAPDRLYRNNGDGTFSDVTVEVGLRKAFGNGLGVACADYNRDGRPDVYVANDGTPNQLWINQGGRFTDQALLSGCAVNRQGVAEAGMGVWALDVEEDGDADLFLTHLRAETNTLYINQDGLFDDVTARMGLAGPSVVYTGFGVGFADFDHDGLQDLYVANGRVMLHVPQDDPADPYAEPNQVFAGRAGGRFQEQQPAGGTADPLVHTSRAAAFGDLDNDGDIDVVVINRDGPTYVLRNVAPKRGTSVTLRVMDARGRDALGAEVQIQAGSVIRTRWVQPSYGYCSSNDPRVHCGLGSAERVDGVAVRWLDGTEEQFGPLAAGAVHVLKQGSGAVAVSP